MWYHTTSAKISFDINISKNDNYQPRNVCPVAFSIVLVLIMILGHKTKISFSISVS